MVNSYFIQGRNIVRQLADYSALFHMMRRNGIAIFIFAVKLMQATLPYLHATFKI